ncbi:MAG: hypothetical protein ACLRZ6_08450 [Lachnospiraceae bacterium]
MASDSPYGSRRKNRGISWDTIAMWNNVRKGEEKYFPYQEAADVVFNSACYELAVLKPYAEPLLLE